MKKEISVLLIIAMIMSFLCIQVYSAAAPEISVSGASGSIGDTVKVDVSISDNVGIASYTLRVNFDNTQLLPVAIYGDNITSNIQQESVELSKLNYVSAVWVSDSNSTDNGVLFSVEFKIISSETTETPLTLSYDAGDICNQDLEDVNPTLKNDSIKLNSISVPTEEPTDKPTESPTATPTPIVTDYPYTINSVNKTEDGKVEVDISRVENAVQTSAIMIIAVFDESGAFADCKTEMIYDSKKYTVDYEIPQDMRIKLYIWDNFDNIKPLSKSVEIKK